MSQKSINETLRTSLAELGLTEHETNLYIISLSKGPTPIKNLGEYLNISRPNIYKVISGLEKHGLANFSEKNGYKKTFMVESPKKVIELLQLKNKKITGLDSQVVELMPDLLAMYRQGELPTSIKILEDRRAYEAMFDSILEETKDEIQFFGAAHDFIAFISWEHENNWISKRVKSGLKMRSLVLPSPVANMLVSKDRKELRETRILKGVLPFSSSFQLFANKVIIWQPAAPLAVVISDEYIVTMLKSIFDALWRTSGTENANEASSKSELIQS